MQGDVSLGLISMITPAFRKKGQEFQRGDLVVMQFDKTRHIGIIISVYEADPLFLFDHVDVLWEDGLHTHTKEDLRVISAT